MVVATPTNWNSNAFVTVTSNEFCEQVEIPVKSGGVVMSNSSLDAVKQKLEDTLAPYGYYVARKDTPDALPITFAELGLVVLGLLAWSATQYLKAFFEEMGKQDAKLLSQATPDTNSWTGINSKANWKRL
jgi:hypothetical protein